MKLNRIYRLIIQLSDGSYIEIDPPFTIEMSIDRNIMARAKTGNFKIYNLSEGHRLAIFRDIFEPFGIQSDGRYGSRFIWCYGGYESETMGLLFYGQIKFAFSYRNNRTEWITEIEGWDSGENYATSATAKTFDKSRTKKEIIQELYKDLLNVPQGLIGEFTEQASRGSVYVGNPVEILNSITDGNFYFDNGVPLALKKSEVIVNSNQAGNYTGGDVRVLNSQSGLINSPRKSNAIIQVQFMFEPNIQVAEYVQLDAQEKAYNGFYKVQGIKHEGMISSTHGGAFTTLLSLWNPSTIDKFYQAPTPPWEPANPEKVVLQ